ncbi:MAG: hypothetical protein O2841_06040 [Actinomycetota bacterium]|nr:hypothetical protein [Actinomycetota bacterium]
MLSLGVSCNHDAGVTVLSDNQIVFAANEERYTRRKFEFGFPENALAEALQYCNVSTFDAVTLDGQMQTPHPSRANLVFGDKTWMSQLAEINQLNRVFFGTRAGVTFSRGLLRLLTQGHRNHYQSRLRALGITGEVFYAEHHKAHAASSSLLFPSDSGLAITVDAFGEGICAGIWTLKHGFPYKQSVVPGYHSVGLMYLYITHLLGFKLGQEGKVTGLAAHGDGSRVRDLLLSRIFFDQNRRTFVNHSLGYGTPALERLKKDLKEFSKEDIAAGAQSALETLVLDYIRAAIESSEFEKPDLYLAGGVFANVSLNRRIAEELQIASVSVAPNMGDGGLSLGAALLNHDSRVTFQTLYLGTEIEPTIVSLPVDLLNQAEERHTSDLEGDVARLLAGGQIVAVARGRMEFGPRALGNRSILAAAGDKGINDSLNKKLRRTEFMPFAPIVRDVDAAEYFELTQELWAYENMTVTCYARDRTRVQCPAIVHVDGTARPQVLTRERNPFVYEILSKYQKMTGVGVLVNTSFNMHEEPIVRTAETAFRSFITGNIDALVLGERLFCHRFRTNIIG